MQSICTAEDLIFLMPEAEKNRIWYAVPVPNSSKEEWVGIGKGITI